MLKSEPLLLPPSPANTEALKNQCERTFQLLVFRSTSGVYCEKITTRR